MFHSFQEEWRQFKTSEPGKRFQERFERVKKTGQGGFMTVLYVGGGLLGIAVGIVMLAAPGPGLVVIAISAGLIAQKSLTAARLLDRLEIWLRPVSESAMAAWRNASAGTRMGLNIAGLVVAGVGAFLSYRLFIGGS